MCIFLQAPAHCCRQLGCLYGSDILTHVTHLGSMHLESCLRVQHHFYQDQGKWNQSQEVVPCLQISILDLADRFMPDNCKFGDPRGRFPCFRNLSGRYYSFFVLENEIIFIFRDLKCDVLNIINSMLFLPQSAFICVLGVFSAHVLNTEHIQVGDDEFGYMLSDMLKENNVNNQGLLFDTHARTALAFVTLRSDGEREFMFYRNPSADMLLEEKELDLDLIRKVGELHGVIILLQYLCFSTTTGLFNHVIYL